jgi:hypothetical protein
MGYREIADKRWEKRNEAAAKLQASQDLWCLYGPPVNVSCLPLGAYDRLLLITLFPASYVLLSVLQAPFAMDHLS